MASAASTTADDFKPTYVVPAEYFTLQGRGAAKGSWLFKCCKCVNKIIAASYTTRANLKSHIKSKHTASYQDFEEKCSKTDKRKRKHPSQKVLISEHALFIIKCSSIANSIA